MTSISNADSSTGKKSKLLWFGFGLILITLLLASSALYMNVRNRESDLEEMLEKQETMFATGRVQNITLWLSDLVVQGDRIVNGDIFRLFASDVDLLEGDVASLFASPGTSPASQQNDVSNLAQQLPMMRNMLREFTSYSGFLSSRIVNKRGETYIASETGVPRLTQEQMDRVKNVLETGHTAFSNIYLTANGMVMDIFMPIFPPQVDDGSEKPLSVLILSRIVTPRIAEFLKASPMDTYKLGTYLVQYDEQNNNFELVSSNSGTDNSMRALPTGMIPRNAEHLDFARRLGVVNKDVYSLGVKVPGVSWWIIQEIDYNDARAELDDYIRTAVGITILLSLVLILAISGMWWWLVGNEQRKIAGRVQNLLVYIEDQKQLLDAINSTISDLISLTDEKGVIQYANLAFANAVGREAEDVVGLDIPALFGFDTGKRLIGSDYQVMMSGEPMVVNEIIYLQSHRHYFQIVKAPLTTTAGRQAKGIVSVYRDITDLVEAQERSQRVVQQTIDALVRTIEESDQYLAGHSRYMSIVATMIARDMNLPETEIATIEAAANLSQIGRMFVPKDILNKPGALTEEEKNIMEGHVEHSRRVLQNIEFDLPIVDTICEMNERLDGTGYPNKLSGDEIRTSARILAVANAFTAMLRPRSYRNALGVEQALAILHKEKGSYDQKVVDALEHLISTPAGERFMNSLSKNG